MYMCTIVSTHFLPKRGENIQARLTEIQILSHRDTRGADLRVMMIDYKIIGLKTTNYHCYCCCYYYRSVEDD